MVLIAPRRKRNSLWSFMFRNCLPINAACEDPSPGRKAVKGAARIEAREVFAMDFFDSFIFLKGDILCSGIFVFCLMLMRRLLAPKSPVNRGRRGSLMFMFSEAIPRKPAKRNMIRVHNLFFGSEIIRCVEIRINRIHIIF